MCDRLCNRYPLHSRVSTANGWYPDGKERPRRYGFIVGHYGPDSWYIIKFDDDTGTTETHSPNAVRLED